MFSIISTGFLRTLVWYTPGSQAISTLTPRSAHPGNPRDIPAPAVIPPWVGPTQAVEPTAPSGSHTQAHSLARESSHTQEFARLRPRRWPKRRL
jgi:hypothetical protein